jgi:hypothetical protein
VYPIYINTPFVYRIYDMCKHKEGGE